MSEGEEDYEDSGWDEDEDAMSISNTSDHDNELISSPVASGLVFRTLSEEQVLLRMEALLADLQEILGIDEGQSTALLIHFKWSKQRAIDAFLGQGDRLLVEVGIKAEHSETHSNDPLMEIECPQCLEDVAVGDTFALDCGHRSCMSCWQEYLKNTVRQGHEAVRATCNYFKCKVIVPAPLFQQLLTSAKDLEGVRKYRIWLLQDFVSGSTKLKWCPGKGCSAVVEALEPGLKDVQCGMCKSWWCFNCQNEIHRPAPCDWVKAWLIKNSSESENCNWISANTKRCPKCSVQIEKNQGCNHMT